MQLLVIVHMDQKIDYIQKFRITTYSDKITCAGIFKQSMGARNRVRIGLSYRLARLHSLAELVPFLGIDSWAP